ncbi:maleylpyruvate isomerase family mycothiol-dependent enzyme [Nocardioides mangrovi]|uniref:Maleylpyruvate isomerase family mycothiol-dependent enzyme n=1 Tax=Nocardioides mangrovi TaxID=2874580 RepID=A0ABS7UH49_9ACTN|nr:maleylpyruvate isomerase family mycothiol-dependent enzyme [Nocardioides mangrovi]MBZ5740001.1 maleylpyruvate isomerase family mycothiol-dependent enzyme [Nocardioides mangrovi]MBZ5740828.1 maleylpyruvate isomerase family mycothiol-dependent enzyme [Nocardioides mangrovi]
MVDTPLPVVAAGLLPDATRRLVRTADGLPDDDYAAPSVCTGWSRAHVLAHLALNAEGLAGALTGIVDGERRPMYASEERRDGDIDELAAASPSALRTRLLAACTDLAEAWAALPADQQATTIDRIPGGRIFAAGAVPLMRVREVEIHHADLDAGYSRADWPADFAALLLDALAQQDDGTPFTARATDLERSWTWGSGGPTVSGTAADLGWWLTGRGAGDGLTSDSGALPRIGD